MSIVQCCIIFILSSMYTGIWLSCIFSLNYVWVSHDVSHEWNEHRVGVKRSLSGCGLIKSFNATKLHSSRFYNTDNNVGEKYWKVGLIWHFIFFPLTFVRGFCDFKNCIKLYTKFLLLPFICTRTYEIMLGLIIIFF